MNVAELVAALALLGAPMDAPQGHPALQDTTPFFGAFLSESCLTFLHDDMSTTSVNVANFLESMPSLPVTRGGDDGADPGAVPPGDWFETEWVDETGVTHRVRTMRSAGRTTPSNARVHGEAVREMQSIFPPRPVTQ